MSNIIEFVRQQEPLFLGALTEQSVTWAKESQFAIQAFQNNDTLAKIALANPVSAQNAIINVAAIGITLNPAAKVAYLVPRDGKVCLDISYMGLLQIAQETGAILWGQCKLVHEQDLYESNGIDVAPTHKYNAFKDRGPLVGVYCTIKTPGGDYLTDEMSISDIEEVRKHSKFGYSDKGPWVKFYNEMARKTVVKRASKYWPRKSRLDNAIHVLNEEEGIFIEPVMPHKSEEDIRNEEIRRQQEITEKVQKICDDMESAVTIEELKKHFADAYRMTSGMKLQQNVQAIYSECKIKFTEAA